MLESTLVVWMGEFGRTPKINPSAGRDHFPKVFNVALAGGGVKGGQVIGESNRGWHRRERPPGQRARPARFDLSHLEGRHLEGDDVSDRQADQDRRRGQGRSGPVLTVRPKAVLMLPIVLLLALAAAILWALWSASRARARVCGQDCSRRAPRGAGKGHAGLSCRRRARSARATGSRMVGCGVL